MMAAVFAATSLALVAGWSGRDRAAAALLALALVLAAGLFLWEIWSPVDGFRMPWIDVRLPEGPGSA